MTRLAYVMAALLAGVAAALTLWPLAPQPDPSRPTAEFAPQRMPPEISNRFRDAPSIFAPPPADLAQASAEEFPAQSDRPPPRLEGVVRDRHGSQALLTVGDGAVIAVSVGETAEGWRIEEIGARSIRLSRDGRIIELGLFRPQSAAER